MGIKCLAYGYGYGGYASFLADDDSYAYRIIDGPVMNEVISLIQKKKPGKAFNIAKKNAKERRKNNGDWESNLEG